MSTDPGELVVDPTCGSGTTAYVAEQWGRRSITIDTSRAGACPHAADGGALPLVSACHSCEGRAKEVALTRSVPAEKPVHNDIRQGFAYERVPHITFKSIADNTLIDDIWQKCQAVLEPLRAAVNGALGKTYEEWQIPRDLAASAAPRPHNRTPNGGKRASPGRRNRRRYRRARRCRISLRQALSRRRARPRRRAVQGGERVAAPHAARQARKNWSTSSTTSRSRRKRVNASASRA